VARLREKAGGSVRWRTAADDLEAALTLKRARRRAADLADEVSELDGCPPLRRPPPLKKALALRK